ncbi:MAG: transcription antitermination factor NusB [Anaerolineales bacterium]|nr:transcription antitermination factor NusB [Anaerolineales bacterium]
MKHQRRYARRIAIQALYEIDSVDHSPESVIARYVDNSPNLSSSNVDFLRTMVLETTRARGTLDNLIAKHAPEWPVDQLAIIDRNILRLALWELAVLKDTPVKVAINEAVELAKLFGSDSAPRFINGVLGSLAEKQADIRQSLDIEETGQP